MLMASAVGGYLVNKYLANNYSRYTAMGLMTVHVAPEVPVPGRPEVIAGSEAITLQQNTQAKTLKHESLFMAVIADDESKIRQTGWWRQFQGERDPLAAAKKDMEDHFEAEPVPNSRLLRVSMTYSDPEDARTIVEEMVNKHIELVKKDQFDIESKKVELLTHQLNSVKLELNEDVIKQERQKEMELGTEQVGTSTTWNGALYQLDRLMQEESKIQAELAGLNSRYQTLTRDLEDGRTPAEVESQINNSMRYLNARQRLDDIDVELDGLIERRGDHDDLVISWKRRRQLYQQKLDETREELKSTYAETIKSMYKNEIDATSARHRPPPPGDRHRQHPALEAEPGDDRVPHAAGARARAADPAEQAERGDLEPEPVLAAGPLGHGRVGVAPAEAGPPQLPQAPVQHGDRAVLRAGPEPGHRVPAGDDRHDRPLPA